MDVTTTEAVGALRRLRDVAAVFERRVALSSVGRDRIAVFRRARKALEDVDYYRDRMWGPSSKAQRLEAIDRAIATLEAKP